MSRWQIVFEDARDADDAYYTLSRSPKYIILRNHNVLDVTLTTQTTTANELEDIFGRYGRINTIVDLTPTTYQIENYPAKDFLSYYRAGKYTDQTLIVGEQSFEVHRIILAAASLYFRDLLAEFEQPVIEIFNVEPNLFADLLDLIYGAEIPLAGLQTLRLMTLVDYFGVQNVNVSQIISQLQIDSADMAEYNNLLNQIYPEGIPANLQ